MNFFAAIAHTMPHMPESGWWLAPVVLFLLGTLSVIDAMTAKVPDPLVLPSLIFITLVQGLFVDWGFAGLQLLYAFGVAFGLYVLNEIWFRATQHDGFGMGDAKWTMLAVACFGIVPAVFA